MLDKLSGIEQHYEEINRRLAESGSDYQRVAELNKERLDLEPIVARSQEYRQALTHLAEARSMLETEADADMRQLVETEILELETAIPRMEKELKSLLVPKDPRDERNVIVEIRAGAGGDEAALFAADLFRMYSRYAEVRKWSVDLLSSNEIGIGGYKEIIFAVKGHSAYSRLKYESGVHRVQRVPVTESSGRIHTSTATVAVLAEVDEVEVNIPDSDIEIEVYRSSGAGGQNVQKNSTAVRLRHLPTGLVVQCQDERSQLQNRLRAMSILRARLYDIEQHKRDQEITDERRSQIGSAERSEKIRTYNFPQSRLTDHRIDQSYYGFKMQSILNGELDEIIDELATRDQAVKLQEAGL
jgi:peptide chain release factor 1